MIDKWHIRFLSLAEHISTWSKDPSTQCGAVVVRPDKTIASVGYNGFPKGYPDLTNWYLEKETKHKNVIHAEMNAILFAKELLVGYTLYTYPIPPCIRCMPHVIQSGISMVVSYDNSELEVWNRCKCDESLRQANYGKIHVCLIQKQ